MTPLYRWNGTYWGFVAGDQVYDRYGRHVGWVAGADVYHLGGRFMGELREGRHVLRHLLRAEPIPLAPRPAVDYPAPPTPPPDLDEREPLEEWNDALAWPLPPPKPPAV